MQNILSLFIAPFLVSSVISYLATPYAIKFAYKIGIIDDPKRNIHPKVIHTYPTPRGGGLSIFFALLISTIIFLPADKYIISILIGATLLTILGVVDDKFNLNPYHRIFLQILIALIPTLSGVGVAFLTNPFASGTIDLTTPSYALNLFGNLYILRPVFSLFTLFWIVALMNFLNMGAKGVDGQLPGVTAIAALTIAVLSLRYSADIAQWSVIILAAIVAGAFLGFLPFNIFPQKIMPSFSGSLLAGYFLAILSILSTTKVGTLIVVLGVPLIDTSYTIIRRVLSGKSPVWGDRGHLHHKLLDQGFSKKQVSYFYWVATATLGLIAINLNSSYKLYAIIGLIILLGGFLLWLTYRSKH
ncbi:MAG TPA: MraY family glycosyltransferase [Patescibacteria group bacterium]|nr:MraY family glycosyltransferase [Patescibacteria group bacterium]